MADTVRHLLLVEDETQLRGALSEQLEAQNFVVTQAGTGDEALKKLGEFAFDVLVTDLRLPDANGAHLLSTALERYPDIVTIVVTGYGTVKDAVEAIKRGATDFVTKPFQFDELLHAINAALEQRRLRQENAYLRQQLEFRHSIAGMVGHSRSMRELAQMIETVAPANSTVLITGETGTGKEVVARAIHQQSARRHHRFVALNCSAIPEPLLEAELFGHVRGAFTGAIAQRQGRLEQAHRGTLFLDEVANMSPSLQMKLLRVLQEREFERLGDSHPIRVDVRVIAATNSDLGRMVKEGTFREDLYYRLNVIEVQVPVLRDRKEDIPLLIQHFLDKFGRESEPPRPPLTVSQQAMRRLMDYAWPGNVRQLENAMERAVALSGTRTQLDIRDLPPELDSSAPAPAPADIVFPDTGIDLDGVLARLERDLIDQSLARTSGNRLRAAKLLNLKRTTLVEKLKRLETRKMKIES